MAVSRPKRRMMMTMMPRIGKGSRQRPGDTKKYRDNYDRIFGKKKDEDTRGKK